MPLSQVWDGLCLCAVVCRSHLHVAEVLAVVTNPFHSSFAELHTWGVKRFIYIYYLAPYMFIVVFSYHTCMCR